MKAFAQNFDVVLLYIRLIKKTKTGNRHSTMNLRSLGNELVKKEIMNKVSPFQQPRLLGSSESVQYP